MHLVDPMRLRASVNADPEFRLAARYWNATLSLESPSRALRVEIADGQVASCRESDAGQPATITVLASDEGGAQFLAAVPRPRSSPSIGREAHEEEGNMTDNHAGDHGRRNFLQLAGCGLGAFFVGAWPARARAQATTASPLKIGSVGAGRMGGALGALFVKAGHPVMFSSRHPENLKDLTTRLGPLAQAGTVEQAVAFGDVVVMVVPYAALEEIGKAHGRALATKPLVLDVCNPIARRDGADLVKWVNEQGGAGLASAKLLPGARIVRAFNGISYRRVGEIAHRPGGLVGVPIAGDDPKAIALAEGLIRGMGFEPVLVGGLAMGKYLLPGTPLAEEHTPAELRQIAAGLR